MTFVFPKKQFHFILFAMLFIAFSCKKNNAMKDDPRTKYVGEWNFKGHSYYFSGFYDYSDSIPVWTYTESESTNYNDSTGSIVLGESDNELLIKYCGSCPPQVYNLDENGQGSWTLNETHFYNDVQPAPPGYTATYTTYNIEGWKL